MDDRPLSLVQSPQIPLSPLGPVTRNRSSNVGCFPGHRQEDVERDHLELRPQPVQDPLDPLDVARLAHVEQEEIGALRIDPREFFEVGRRVGLRPFGRQVVVIRNERPPVS